MRTTFVAFAAAAALGAAIAQAGERDVPEGGFGRLDHVFLIVMENQSDTDILGNANAPFINSYALLANQATNYFAVGHPSAPNYLEMTGGSNFGVPNDYWPNWYGRGCADAAPGSTGCNHAVTPIAVAAMDNPVVATASDTSQCNGQVAVNGNPVANNCALYDYPAALFTPKSIADQLVERHRTWKS